jgi:hypothetical protein
MENNGLPNFGQVVQNNNNNNNNNNTNNITNTNNNNNNNNNNTSQQQNPFDWGSLIAQLYGGNPYQVAAGNNGGLLAQLLSQATGNNMGNIAAILNALYATQTSPSNSLLSPLFWGSSQSVPRANYYPGFY